MIIELIGPKAVGKTTAAALLAERLGIRHYLGQGFHRLDGTELRGWREWAERTRSVARSPGLFLAAWRIRGGSAKERMRFALNACRRDRLAAVAAITEHGVVESGPLNSLIQATASYDRDVTPLHSRIAISDIYVRLRAPASEITRRLESRGGVSESRVARHDAWVDRYEKAADDVLARIGRPVVEVNATTTPEGIVDNVVHAMEDLGWPEALEHRG